MENHLGWQLDRGWCQVIVCKVQEEEEVGHQDDNVDQIDPVVVRVVNVPGHNAHELIRIGILLVLWEDHLNDGFQCPILDCIGCVVNHHVDNDQEHMCPCQYNE